MVAAVVGHEAGNIADDLHSGVLAMRCGVRSLKA